MLPEALVAAMRRYCGGDHDTFSIECFVYENPEWAEKLSYYDRNGAAPGEEHTFDALALMAEVSDEFEFTEDGWDCFIVGRCQVDSRGPVGDAKALGAMAVRLWAVSQHLRSYAVDGNPALCNALGEACDDIAIVLAGAIGLDYSQFQEAVEAETFEPTYKFSRATGGS